MIGVILFCKIVPFTTNFFISIVLNHPFTENMISQESIMDSFCSPSFCISFSNYGPDDILCFLEVSHICGHEVFPSCFRILELKEGPTYTQWNFDWPLFLSRDARTRNRRCLHSNMIGMLCTASLGLSQTIQTALHCPRPKSSALTSHWTGSRLCFVVEHVDLGGSRFSSPILERWYSARASQQNVVTLEFGSPCSPRSALFALDLIRHGLQRVAKFYRFLTASSWKERVSISWERDVFLPSCSVLVLVPTAGCSVRSVLTTGCPVLSWSGFGTGWFDWKLLNCCTTCPSGRWASSEPNSFIQLFLKEILGGGRGDSYTFSYMISPVSIRIAQGIQ